MPSAEEVARAGAMAARHPILVVEDDRDVRELMSEMLAESGFTVYAAPGAREALIMLDELDRDPIILLDLYMPGMNGWSFLRELRQKGSGAPVIVTSATPDARDALAAGANMFMSKPFGWEALLGAVLGIYDDPDAPAAV